MKIKTEEGKEIEIDDSVVNAIKKQALAEFEPSAAVFEKASQTVTKNILQSLTPELQALLTDKVRPGMRGKDLGELLSDVYKDELTKRTSANDDSKKTDIQKQIDEVRREYSKQLAELQKQGQQERIKDRVYSHKEKLKAVAIKKNLRPENEIVYNDYLDKFFDFQYDSDRDAIVTRNKISGELFFNREGKDASPDDIVGFIKEKFPSLHVAPAAGAGIGAGSQNPPSNGGKPDLNKSSSQLIEEGFSELPAAQDFGKSI